MRRKNVLPRKGEKRWEIPISQDHLHVYVHDRISLKRKAARHKVPASGGGGEKGTQAYGKIGRSMSRGPKGQTPGPSRLEKKRTGARGGQDGYIGKGFQLGDKSVRECKQ